MDLTAKNFEQLQALIIEAQYVLAQKQKAHRKDVIAQIKSLADSAGLIIQIKDDKTHIPTRKPVAIKYQNPNNPLQVWTGRGLKPKWLVSLLTQGVSLDSLVVNQ
jgi:DNA-binding protein H-NS